MLAIVNSPCDEEINQMALSAAAGMLLEYGHPYEIFFHYEVMTLGDPEVLELTGRPCEKSCDVWVRAEEAALDALPSVSDDTFLVWMGDN